jgi:hypothetical protein
MPAVVVARARRSAAAAEVAASGGLSLLPARVLGSTKLSPVLLLLLLLLPLLSMPSSLPPPLLLAGGDAVRSTSEATLFVSMPASESESESESESKSDALEESELDTPELESTSGACSFFSEPAFDGGVSFSGVLESSICREGSMSEASGDINDTVDSSDSADKIGCPLSVSAAELSGGGASSGISSSKLPRRNGLSSSSFLTSRSGVNA